MNPLDPSEFNIVRKTLLQDMPIHTPTTTKVKHIFQQFPKDLNQYCDGVNEKYLDHNLDIIEEINHRKPKNSFCKEFKSYQNHYFVESRIKDHFLKPDFTEHRSVGSYHFLGSMMGFPSMNRSVNGSELSVGASSTHTASSDGNIYAIRKTSGVTANTLYNQLAIDIFAASGNVRLAAYHDSGSVPDTLYSETSSFAAATGYGYQSCTEYEILQTIVSLAMQLSSSTCDVYYDTSLTRWSYTQAFGAFAADISSASNAGAVAYAQKTSHT